MPGKILGIEINDKNVTAVQVVSGLKGYNLASCARINVLNGNLEKALNDLSHQIDLKSDNTHVSIPGRDISFRNMTVPFRDSKKIRQTLPFELENLTPLSVENLIVDFNIINSEDQTEILAVTADRGNLSQYLSILSSAGIDPDTMDINPVPAAAWLINQEICPENGIYLDLGIDRNCMVIFNKGHIALVREFALSPSVVPEEETNAEKGDNSTKLSENDFEKSIESFCDNVIRTMHSFEGTRRIKPEVEKIFYGGAGSLYSGTEKILSGFFSSPLERINISSDKRYNMDNTLSRIYKPALMDNALALCLRDPRKPPGFNLRQGEFEVKRRYFGPKQEIKKAAVLLGILFLFLILDLSLGYYSIEDRYETLTETVTEQRIRMYPETARIRDNDLAFMEIEGMMKDSPTKQGSLISNQKVLDILKDIATRINSSYDMDVTNMVIDSDTVRISGNTDDFPTIDGMKNDLEPSPLYRSVAITSATLDRSGNRVRFELKLTRAY